MRTNTEQPKRGNRKGLTLRDHRRARPPYRIEEEV